jgi:thiamine pyrophosphate-dependent acetolactate synthase large subunit-like protein
MSQKTGRFVVLEQFVADGFRYMFGNPGTVEQGFLDALDAYPQLQYVLTLQESVAVLIGDGYARAARKPALVQIHSTPGLGNALGALYQAKRGHAPLVVIGGDAGVKYQAMDSQMAGDLVAMAAPFTKYSTMALEPSSLLRVVRRAIKIATTPPMGPVYVCLPMDVLDAPAVEEVVPTSPISTRVAPEDDAIRKAAVLLAAADQPMVFVGDGVAFSGAQPELARVAELLGAEVWEVDAGELNIDHTHPLYRGGTGHMFGYQSLPITTKGDVNLVCGTYMVNEVFPELGTIFAEGAQVIHIDLNAYEIAKCHPVTVGLVSDPKLTLGLLAAALEGLLTPAQKSAAAARAKVIGEARADELTTLRENDRKNRDHMPMHLARFMEELVPRLPEDAIIFDEALTCSPDITRHWVPHTPGQYFLTRGGSLGVGIPGSIGAKFANPDKTVIGFTGDGGSMYTIQALWTAARHNLDVKFVICNNGSYRLLQVNIEAYWKERQYTGHDYPLCFDLSQPPIGFVGLAEAMGVQGARIEKPEQIGPALDKALSHRGPFLLDVVVEGNVKPEMIGMHCGQ